jgi:hypothetical protein
MEQICFDFYQALYKHKDISEDALEEVLRDLPITFTPAMNELLSKEITEEELGLVAKVMAKGKAPGYDDISLEFFPKNLAICVRELPRHDSSRIRGGDATRGHHQGLD